VAEHGLVALPGGRHPGAGTANRIVPLGPAYLELIAVVDDAEASSSQLSRRVSAALERRAGIATWAVRVGDLDAVRARLDAAAVPAVGPRAGFRRRPDGVLLEWRTLHVGDGLEPAIPFFIEWRLSAGQHPGGQAVDHPAGAVRLKSLRLSAPSPERLEERLRSLLGGLPALTFEQGEREEVTAVVLDVGGVEGVLRGAEASLG